MAESSEIKVGQISIRYLLDGECRNAGTPPDKAALVSEMARYGLVPAAPSSA